MQQYFKYKLKNIHKYIRLINNSNFYKLIAGFIVGSVSMLIVNNINIVIIVLLWLVFIKPKYSLLLIFIFAGSLYSFYWQNSIDNETLTTFNTEYVGTAVIVSDPIPQAFNQKLTLKLEDKKLYAEAIAPKYPTFKQGDKVEISGKLAAITTNARFFNTKRIFYAMQIDEIELSSNINKFSLYYLSSELRAVVISEINSNYAEPNASLVNGVVLGNTTNFTKEFKDDLKATGTNHIVSVSGFNVMLIYISLLSFAGSLNRKLLNVLSIFLIVIYFFTVGIHNLPAFRATGTIIFIVLSNCLGRKPNYIISLLFAVLVILLEFPYYIFNISLQLSLFATLGLVLFSKDIGEKFTSILKNNYISEIIATCLVAYFCTLPLIAYSFGETSLSGILVNITIAPMVGMLTTFSILTVIANLANIPLISSLLLHCSSLISETILLIINQSSNYSLSINSRLPILGLILVFAAVYILWDIKVFKQKYQL